MPEGRFGEKVKSLGRAQADLEQALSHIGGNHQLREKIQGRTAAIQTELTQMAAEATGRGQQLYGESNCDGAFMAFSESLSTNQGNRSEALFLRALCSVQKQQPESAIKDLNESLQLIPQQPEALFQRANCQRLKRDLQAALVDMNAAAQMGHAGAAQQVVPLQQEIQAEQHYQQAQAMFQKQDFPATDQMCAQALAVFPAHAAAIVLQKEARDAMAADMAIAHVTTQAMDLKPTSNGSKPHK